MDPIENMDDIFKNKLSQYKSSGTERLWAGIQQRRKNPNRKPFLFWFLLLSGFALAGLGAWQILRTTQPEMTGKSENREIAATAEQKEIVTPKKNTQITAGGTIDSKSPSHRPIVKTEPTDTGHQLIKNRISTASPAKKITPAKNSDSVLKSPSQTTGAGRNTQRYAQSELSLLSTPKTQLFRTEKQLPELSLCDPETCFDFNSGATLSALYFEGLIGPAYANRSLALRDEFGPELNYYLQARDSTERSWYAVSAALRLAMRYEGGLTLRGGVNYTQINEIFDYQNGRENRTTTIEILDANGNYLRTDTVYESGQRIKTSYNRLKLLDIPFMLGYESAHKNWTASINAGAYLNVLFRQKGDILNTALVPVSIDTGTPEALNVFNFKAGLSLAASVGFSYKISDKLHWQIEPEFRYFTRSFTKTTSLEQHYWNIALFTGLRYYFISKK